MRKIPKLIVNSNYQLKCLLFRNNPGEWILIHVTNQKDTRLLTGIAVDHGTSRIAIRLVDLTNGIKIGEAIFNNPRIAVGPDILERIHYGSTSTGLLQLNSLITSAINHNSSRLCLKCNTLFNDVYMVSVAGNTAITHLFLKISPEYISKKPYTSSINKPGIIKAKEAGIQVNSNAQMFVFPSVGSYFGGDLIAGILYSGLSEKQKASVLLDIGTNAEIVFRNKEWMIGCAAAGPALESDVTKTGTMAGAGIIDRVYVDSKSKTIKVKHDRQQSSKRYMRVRNYRPYDPPLPLSTYRRPGSIRPKRFSRTFYQKTRFNSCNCGTTRKVCKQSCNYRYPS